MPQFSNRLDRLPPYVFVTITQNVQNLTSAGHDVYRLDVGNPDMPPPKHVIEAMTQAINNPGNHGYAGYRGIPAFRQAIADHYKRRFGVELDPETEVLPLLGSKEGIVNLMLAYVDSESSVLVGDISYPAYEMGTLLSDGGVKFVPMPAENNYLIDFAQISSEDATKAKMLWVNYPNNPTGAMADMAFYQDAVEFCREYDLLLASDNPYVDITYDGNTAGSVLQVDSAKDHAIEFMSFSKTYNMAGWRLGAAVGNAGAIKNLLNIKSNMDSGHFKATYEAGIAALQQTPQSWIDERNAYYQRRRDKIIAVLPEIGLQANVPGGSMYIWAKVLDGDSTDYVMRALNDAHVSIAPGSAYGPGGDGFVRISLGVPDTRLDNALDRLKSWYTRG